MKQNKNEIMFLNKHNTMIKSKYNLNVAELRMYLFILYNLQKEVEVYKNVEDVKVYEEHITFSISRKSFDKIISDKQYLKMSKIESVFEGLRKKPVYYEVEKSNNKKDWSVFGFILKYSYISSNDSYMFTLDKIIYDMVITYKAFGYTPLNLALMFTLNCVYSYRLYELLRLWSNTKNVINYKISDLKEYLMIADKKSYNVYANFKNKVILPAIKELNELELFKITIEEVKIGRKVDSINFIVEDMDRKKQFDLLEEVKNKNIIECEEIESEDKPNVKSSFYVPNKKLFTPKTLESFEQDFSNYDFKDRTYKEILQKAILTTLDKDDEDKIKVKQYNYFKTTLQDMLNKKALEKQQQSYKPKSKPAVFHNINNPTARYTGEELMEMIQKSQKAKFGK